VIIACPACAARFQYDEKRFAGTLSKHFKCLKCGAVFECLNPSQAAAMSGTRGQGREGRDEGVAPASQAFQAANTASQAFQAANTASQAFQAPQPNFPATSNRELITRRARLVSLTGPNASMAFELINIETIIGRDEGDIITNDPETSGRHARIEIMADGALWLSDLGSKNGTFTNGMALTGKIQLSDRQEFVCGKSAFMVRIDS